MENKQFIIDNSVKEVVIREGKALELKEPSKVLINGVLDTPYNWLKGRFNIDGRFIHKNIDNIIIEKCHVIVDREEMTIMLVIDEENHYKTVVSGSLQLHPAFLKFNINKGVYLTPFEMADLIKMNRTFFENQSAAMNLVYTLKNFKAKVDKQIEASDDNRGNKRALIEQAVESNLPGEFNMVLPIFKGQKKETIAVEVYINSSDLTCTLISPEANDITEKLRDEAISDVIKSIKELIPNIVIIEK